jgi:two-component system, OmpR family, sensor kinase
MFKFLRRTPLRVKLVAGVLALVTAALVVIGVAVSYAMNRYLNTQIDNQLIRTTQSVDVRSIPQAPVTAGFYPPSNWVVTIKSTTGVGLPEYDFMTMTANDLPKWPTTVAQVEAVSGKLYTVKSANGRLTWRMFAEQLSNGQVLYIGQTLNDVQAAIHRLILIELGVGGATLIISGALGAALVRTSVRPLVEIEETAEAIAAGDLTRRVPDFEPPDGEPRTEVGRLGQALNVMLGQIETSFDARTESEHAAREAAEMAQDAAEAAQRSESRAVRSENRMRQFAADASHELRTPLTTIRGFAELYRQGAASSPEQTARLIRRIEDEAARMGLLVEDMLLLARLDQERPLETLPVDLRVIGADSVVNARAVAPERDIELEIDPGAGSMVVIGDELRLRQVVTNLMTNALTYTPVDGPIVIRLGRSQRDGFVELSVIDSGPGLSEEQIGHIFERFYRADSARTRRAEGGLSSGTGLGLAIVAAIVKAHGGTVDVASRSRSTETAGELSGAGGSAAAVEVAVAHGVTFRVALPAAPVEGSDSSSEFLSTS